MDAGGWPMLNMWLVEAKKAQNTALLIELLQVCTHSDGVQIKCTIPCSDRQALILKPVHL